ncbi:unnamed protein product [Cochlearia groenlandica]
MGQGGGEEDKSRGFAEEAGTQHQHPHHQYGTFQGVSNYPPPPPSQNSAPVTGFPQPSAPPGVYDSAAPHYPHGYQTVPVHGVAEGRPVIVRPRQRRLPCCGIGLGWFFFIVGFFLGAIPWYIGMFIMIVGKVDHREKPGYIACTIAAILATIAVILGVSKGAEDW